MRKILQCESKGTRSVFFVSYISNFDKELWHLNIAKHDFKLIMAVFYTKIKGG